MSMNKVACACCDKKTPEHFMGFLTLDSSEESKPYCKKCLKMFIPHIRTLLSEIKIKEAKFKEWKFGNGLNVVEQ